MHISKNCKGLCEMHLKKKMPGLCPYLKFISVRKNHLVCDLKNEIDMISQTTTLEDTTQK